MKPLMLFWMSSDAKSVLQKHQIGLCGFALFDKCAATEQFTTIKWTDSQMLLFAW